MRTFNTYYKDIDDLDNFISKNSIDQHKDILVQVFSSVCDEKTLQLLTRDILKLLPNAKIIGATTDGEILGKNVSTDKIVISITEFKHSTLNISAVENDGNSFECGEKLAKDVIHTNTKLIILFADGLSINGEDFLDGVSSVSKDIMLAGGMAGDGARFKNTYVFSNDKVISNGAVGVSINSKNLNVKNAYSFFWQEIGKELIVTKVEDNRVYEINGVSAVDTYRKYLGEEAAKSLPAIGIEFPLILNKDGVKVARAVLGKGDDGSLVFAGNLHIGDRVHFGFGNANAILSESIQIGKEFHDTPVESIFIYSCMARRRFLEDAISVELEPLSKVAPSSGFFTYGEFFKSDEPELLNQTMTVISLSESDDVSKYQHEEDAEIDSKIKSMNATNKALSHLIDQTTHELKETNENLESLVAIKTKELQNKVKELQTASKVKSDFLASMSHEIRTPLNAILGFVDILRGDEKDKQRQKYFSIIKNSGNTLLTVINDILDFSKIESGKMTFEKRKFATKKPFKEIGLLFYERAKEKGIELKINFDDNLPRFFVGDIVRVKQIASNFLSNAIKFTDQGGKITMSTHYDKQRDVLIFCVKDTGSGIDKKNLDKIFEAFTQADSSTTRKYGGTGLGLSISATLIKAMNGTIDVQSELGKGSEFCFYLPLVEADEDAEHEHSKEALAKLYMHNKLSGNVLLVEDNETNQILVNLLLDKVDLQADLANNGLEGVNMFNDKKYDLILMDENMPKMNGIEATKVIREIEKEKSLSPTPIVALTANALSEDKDRFINAGMDDFIAKPIEYETFVKILHRFLACKIDS
ncbi:FIST N-terminal domain-containing protein [Sulfurimonas sp.]|uniref:FIST N-terminal domain-containing protein n=1 Tax=Sulfurimonas sp. TaxID=2022749 RepID=UPI003564EF23